jgi:hypothetical protein
MKKTKSNIFKVLVAVQGPNIKKLQCCYYWSGTVFKRRGYVYSYSTCGVTFVEVLGLVLDFALRPMAHTHTHTHNA